MSKSSALYEREAEQLEERILAEKAINKRLRQELEQKQALLNKNGSGNSAGLADFILQRLEEAVEALRRQGEDERNRLHELMQVKREEHDSRREDLDRRLAERLADYEREQKRAQEERLKQAEEAKLEEERQAREEATREQLRQGEPLLANRANVVPFRAKPMTDIQQAAEPELKMVTADGASAPAAQNQPEAAQRMSYEPSGPVLPDKGAASSAFWGDVSFYMADDNRRADGPAAALPEDPAFSPPAAHEKMPAGYPRKRAEAEVAASAAEPSPRTAKPKPSNGSPAPADESGPGAGSPALAEEIRSIQYRYIAGKAAGENLYGEDGALIIAKGEIITADTIKRAERAGKMPDLIVQMVIPGLTELS